MIARHHGRGRGRGGGRGGGATARLGGTGDGGEVWLGDTHDRSLQLAAWIRKRGSRRGVGLVTAACLAEMGNSVVCVDVDPKRVEDLNRGIVPIHEPGLDVLMHRNVASRRLSFTLDAAEAVAQATLIFIAVGTPSDEDGSADLAHVLNVARSIGQHMDDYKVIVDKSTVPVGTAALVRGLVHEALAARHITLPFAVGSNPAFLREGSTV